MDIAHLRNEYRLHGLRRKDLEKNPLDQFYLWFSQAEQAKIQDPNAMSLATVGADGQPTVRTVLLKAFDKDGFVFYTNYRSKKARDIGTNAKVSLCFLWLELERQIIINGSATRCSNEENEVYFNKRPIGSQLGAWASEQSRFVASREKLDSRFTEVKARYSGEAVPLPDFWGGFRVSPVSYEFWQGRANRLHDRFRYESCDGSWKIERLMP